jgi:hypothetical protein
MQTHRFSANRPRPQSPLDNIKFICKDLWPLLFRKQIDNLKTNHRGVFVLTDQRFQPISRVSVDRKAGVKASEETLSRAQAVSLIPPPSILEMPFRKLFSCFRCSFTDVNGVSIFTSPAGS